MREGAAGLDARSPAARGLDAEGRTYRRRIAGLAAGIALFAGGQVLWALALDARQFMKDGIDWVYDVGLYALAAATFGHGPRVERAAALAVAAVLAVAGGQTLSDLWDKIATPRPIDLDLLGFSAASAVVIGLVAVALLWRFRRSDNPLIRATWLSARNDAVTTTLFAAVTFAVRVAPVRWPEYALDVLAAGLSFQAAGAIVVAAWRDRRAG